MAVFIQCNGPYGAYLRVVHEFSGLHGAVEVREPNIAYRNTGIHPKTEYEAFYDAFINEWALS